MKNIAIIGAGITGITTAYQLLERGYTVSVFDKNRYAAMETSFANGGQLSACNAEVWNSWSTIGKGIQWMLKKDAPLLFSPKLNLHKIGWIMDFIRNIPNHQKNTILTYKFIFLRLIIVEKSFPPSILLILLIISLFSKSYQK